MYQGTIPSSSPGSAEDGSAGGSALDEEDKPTMGVRNKSIEILNTIFCGALVMIFLIEFISSLLYTFIGGMSLQNEPVIVTAAAQGLVFALLIACGFHISGGHVNPMVTLGMAICGDTAWRRAPIYWIAQFLGAIVGGSLIRACLASLPYHSINGGCIPLDLLHGPSSIGQAIVLEFVITFLLVHTAILYLVDKGDEVQAPLGIGFAVFVGICAAARDDGASMNPARSFGPLLIYSLAANESECEMTPHCFRPIKIWKSHYVHWIGPVIGSVLAAVFNRFWLQNRKFEEVEEEEEEEKEQNEQ